MKTNPTEYRKPELIWSEIDWNQVLCASDDTSASNEPFEELSDFGW